ncbi:MAG: type II toxin-antitoxin system RelE/ParE family toxin [Candidatus Kapaibacterium sp.]
MVRKVRWSRSALVDLQNLFEYITESSPLNAFRLADRIRKASESLNSFPERGRIIPEFEDPTLREIFISQYRLMYQVLQKEIIITAVIHMSRDLQNLFPPNQNV